MGTNIFGRFNCVARLTQVTHLNLMLYGIFLPLNTSDVRKMCVCALLNARGIKCGTQLFFSSCLYIWFFFIFVFHKQILIAYLLLLQRQRGRGREKREVHGDRQGEFVNQKLWQQTYKFWAIFTRWKWQFLSIMSHISTDIFISVSFTLFFFSRSTKKLSLLSARSNKIWMIWYLVACNITFFLNIAWFFHSSR